MKHLFLEDLADTDLSQLKVHLLEEYKATENQLKGITILVAYESVGSWGCDSSSFFLFRQGGKLWEVHGSHCSCYGFEDQWLPEETSLVALKDRAEKGNVFYCGGYDNNSTVNQKLVAEFVKGLRK
jgi:hypothetical protein